MLPSSMSHAVMSIPAPELLSPAGDLACITAAIENGADAVYFGLQAHNARARAHNFPIDELPELMTDLRRRGVRGYVTLNTLVFPSELAAIEDWVRQVAQAGVDAVIVQDIGLTRLIRAVAPGLEVHASTQMSVTSEAGVEMARELGCSRVILARELSLEEIGRVRAASSLPVEVFVHGALCVAYSGQCLTSEALGGRSANRGECAQACRMPYQIICDGKLVELDRVQYLLSPQDLAGIDLVPELVKLGVSSLKIEGRLKSPEYVATVTKHYREAIDRAVAGSNSPASPESRYEMEMTFSRGFSTGFLKGNDHKRLVRGDYAKKRGVLLGSVAGVSRGWVTLDLDASVKPGDGVVFDGNDVVGLAEQGGRVYEVRATRSAQQVHLAFGRHDIDLDRLRVGQRVWKTDDPELTRRLRQSFAGSSRRSRAVDVVVRAVTGEPLEVLARIGDKPSVRVVSAEALPRAERRAATPESLLEQFDRLGGTCYRLGTFRAEFEGAPMVPASVLNAVRREIVSRLDAQAVEPIPVGLGDVDRLTALKAEDRAENRAEPAEPISLALLCRTLDQAVAARESGARRIYLEFQDIKGYRAAVAAARGESSEVCIATPRIEKPGEAKLFAYLAKQGADGLLVRNAGGISFCRDRNVPFVADFALNAANELTVGWLLGRGARRVTASYDLSADQLLELLETAPAPDRLEIVIHQRVPMFHMEHCVFCAFLSPGNDHTNCGRPCDHHQVKLRDRVGMEHPLTADVGCRNTLYNAVPQSAAEFLPRLISAGARSLRVEFLDETAAEVERIAALYRQAIGSSRDSRTLWRDLRASSQYGVTRGSLAVLG